MRVWKNERPERNGSGDLLLGGDNLTNASLACGVGLPTQAAQTA